MKKLMIAAAVAVCAAAVNAATVNWGSSSIYVPVHNTTVGKESEYVKANSSTRIVSGSLWEFATEDAFSKYSSMTAEQLYAAKDELGKATNTGTTSGTGGLTISGMTNYGENDYAYGVIIYEFNDGVNDWYAAYAKDSGKAVGTGISVTGILSSSKTDVSAWHKVESIPEPTSGLLLLLGLGAMALRRRRA